MANGGGHQYDLVSASGDADLRLIYGGNVRPVNIGLMPSWGSFHCFLRVPPFNTINGHHYGISYEFGPNVLLYSTKTFPKAPASWSVIYSSKYKGKVTVPDNPIQIADAALYLSKTKPSLKITDPYELNATQFNAAVNLLKAAAPAHQEVLGPREPGDLALPERRDRRRRGVAVPDEHPQGGGRQGVRHHPARGCDGLG